MGEQVGEQVWMNWVCADVGCCARALFCSLTSSNSLRLFRSRLSFFVIPAASFCFSLSPLICASIFRLSCSTPERGSSRSGAHALPVKRLISSLSSSFVSLRFASSFFGEKVPPSPRGGAEVGRGGGFSFPAICC